METTCSVEGCGKPARRVKALYCEMHYMRMYRNGVLNRIIEAKPLEHSHGYILIPAKGHPLAKGSSHVYEHRAVFYNAHGAGPFNCHWCQSILTWDDMHIDHLDDDKKNNLLANLVASCPVCNQKRGFHKARKTWANKTGLTAFGKTMTLNQWAEELKISRASIIARLKRGWSLERTLSEPRGKQGPPSATCRSSTRRTVCTNA